MNMYDGKDRERVHCHSCNWDGDIFDVIGLKGIVEFNDKLAEACRVLGVQIDNQGKSSTSLSVKQDHWQCGSERLVYNTYTPTPSEQDFNAYIDECARRIKETDYPQRRGLSDDVVARFRLGYDPNFIGNGGRRWKALIIPTGDGSFVARNTDPDALKGDKHKKPAGAKAQMYNRRALYDSDKPVFVVEGALDALSIITAGGEAVALGGVAIDDFLEQVRNELPEQPLIIALDNDAAGERVAGELAEELQRLNILAYRRNLYGTAKDANEALTNDRDAFIAEVKNAENIEREAYCARAYLNDFIDGIKDSVNTPYIPTGFPGLDKELGGGLYEGLYIVGAISSLGKTTLALQIADNIAGSGHEVFIFSLEMARYELMSKSISRQTAVSVELMNHDLSKPSDAKTARGITDGKRYQGYTDVYGKEHNSYSTREIDLINCAIKDYAKYAENIHIVEGIGNIGVKQIWAIVERHKIVTGKAPVVFVDYLQILAPHNERATDKQNTDKAVLELKRLSRELKIPVIGISSFNRMNYNAGVSMEAFKESGAIEYSSDILIGLQVEGADNKELKASDIVERKKATPRKIELVILKNRNGKVGGKIPFDYWPHFNYFVER
jgi:replicative DNA helicase